MNDEGWNAGIMNDEGWDVDDQEFKFSLPEWLTESSAIPGDMAMLAFEQEMRGEGQAVDGGWEGEVALPRRRHVYQSSEWSRVSPRLFRCRVTISSPNGEYQGEADGPEIPGIRAEIAARATLDALNRAEGGDIAVALKGARVLRVFEAPIVVIGVYGLNTGETIPLVGAALVENSVEQAAILATLQAADRWLSWQAKKHAK